MRTLEKKKKGPTAEEESKEEKGKTRLSLTGLFLHAPTKIVIECCFFLFESTQKLFDDETETLVPTWYQMVPTFHTASIPASN